MKKTCFLLVLALVLGGCASLRRGGTGGWVILPTALEVSIGQAVDGGIRGQYPLLRDEALQDYIGFVGQRLAAVSDRRDLAYTFQILDTPLVNAFAAPGGFIYVTTGLLALAGDEAELAVVLGHEIGHVAARHAAQRLQAAVGISALAALADLEQKSETFQTVVGVALGLALQAYSRENEYESDYLGAVYAARLGYDPGGVESFFRKLQKLEGRRKTFLEAWFSSHPATEGRIQEYQKFKDRLPASSGERYIQRYQTATDALKKRNDLREIAALSR